TGDLHFTGGLHVDGRVKGNVVAEDDNSMLSLSENGAVEGEIHVPNILLDGEVNGDVHAGERVELGVHARVNGDVYYNLIEMAVGASVNGKLVHRPTGSPRLLGHAGNHAEQAGDDESEK
ncbi:MAG: polymer-forming cytoskeletal protein, partial [Gammaproteobacteria bacterium]